MDRLELIFASRELLARCGLSTRKRRLTSLRLQKLKEFQELVTDQPHVYGGIGSDGWIRGLLTQLNEPGVVAWDDVVEWLSESDVAELLEKDSKAPPTGGFKKPVNSRQTLGDTEEMKVQDGGGEAVIENDIMDNLEYNDVSASELAEAVDEYFQGVLKVMEQSTLDEDLQKDLMSLIGELS